MLRVLHPSQLHWHRPDGWSLLALEDYPGFFCILDCKEEKPLFISAAHSLNKTSTDRVHQLIWQHSMILAPLTFAQTEAKDSGFSVSVGGSRSITAKRCCEAKRRLLLGSYFSCFITGVDEQPAAAAVTIDNLSASRFLVLFKWQNWTRRLVRRASSWAVASTREDFWFNMHQYSRTLHRYVMKTWLMAQI